MAGGQATNAGIDYQQRIAAWCLINQFSKFDISIFFDQIEEELIIDKVLFETSDNIDDLVLVCRNQNRVFLQIKRSISLSIRENSDFYKTIKQFVSEFVKNENSEDYFGLITTSDASSKITNDLKKLVASVKVSMHSLEDNPLNESEKDVLNKFESLFVLFYENIKKVKASKGKFVSFMKRIFIAVIDIESGNTVEVASYMLLKSIGFNQPGLIWATLIKNSLFYATERLSVDRDKLNQIFGKYLEDEKSGDLKSDTNEILKTRIINKGEYPAAKEVLFVKSFIDDFDYLLLELYRFDDACQIRHIFYSNKAAISNGDEFDVIQRFATLAGFDRFMEENHEQYSGSKIAIAPAREIDNVEETECAQLHKDYLKSLLIKNDNVLICLHCGKGISDTNALLVEIEDRETLPAVGNVHKKCLRPIDRVLGITGMPRDGISAHLEVFDFKLWISLVMKGQGMLNSLKLSPQLVRGRNPIIGWNGNEEYDSEYSYCIKFILEDGSIAYSYQRGRIERLNKAQAQEHIELFDNIQAKQIEKKDPWCSLSVSRQSGPYSELIKVKKPDDLILEIKRAEISKYSKLVAKAFDKDISFYTPLCIVRDKEYETIINLNNVVPLISDPLKIDDFYDNWKKIGFDFDSIELKIIKSDKDFDYYMRMIFGDDMIPIIDPLFDMNFNLVSGYPIDDFNRMMQKAKKDKGEDHDSA